LCFTVLAIDLIMDHVERFYSLRFNRSKRILTSVTNEVAERLKYLSGRTLRSRLLNFFNHAGSMESLHSLIKRHSRSYSAQSPMTALIEDPVMKERVVGPEDIKIYIYIYIYLDALGGFAL